MRENMNYDELHSTYFDSGLKIRAICDDLEYPAEFAQVFLYIHIRGPEHYKDQAKMESMANIMAEYYNPENQEKLKNSRVSKDSKTKSLFSNIVIGKEFERADNFLLENENTDNYFSNQINNIRKLYTDNNFRKKMINIYENNIKKLISSYSKEKVEKAFERARLIKNINLN
jgi:hypothetical protein